MFQVTLKVKQIKRLATSSVKNNSTHTSETESVFFIAEGQILAQS